MIVRIKNEETDLFDFVTVCFEETDVYGYCAQRAGFTQFRMDCTRTEAGIGVIVTDIPTGTRKIFVATKES